MSTYRLYSSDLYVVDSYNGELVIGNVASGETRSMQGDDADVIAESIEVCAARVPDAKVQEATDYYLSQYFGE